MKLVDEQPIQGRKCAATGPGSGGVLERWTSGVGTGWLRVKQPLCREGARSQIWERSDNLKSRGGAARAARTRLSVRYSPRSTPPCCARCHTLRRLPPAASGARDAPRWIQPRRPCSRPDRASHRRAFRRSFQRHRPIRSRSPTSPRQTRAVGRCRNGESRGC